MGQTAEKCIFWCTSRQEQKNPNHPSQNAFLSQHLQVKCEIILSSDSEGVCPHIKLRPLNHPAEEIEPCLPEV